MQDLTVQIRSFEWKDISALAHLLSQLPDDWPGQEQITTDWLRRQLAAHPHVHPDQDIFLAWEGSDAYGYALLEREEPISRGVMREGVAPAWRRKGIGRLLLDRLVAHVRQLRLAVLHVDIAADNTAAKGLLTKAGFIHVRTHWHLRREALDRTEVKAPSGYTLRLMDPSEVEALTELQNAAFAGSWGYCPNTPEQLRYQLFHLHEQPDEVVVLEQDGALVGYCWTHKGAAGQPGFVGMMGVHPLHRSKGLGRVVTGAGVDLLLDGGVSSVELTVDSENPPAVRMYEALGFGPEWTSHWYELRLR